MEDVPTVSAWRVRSPRLRAWCEKVLAILHRFQTRGNERSLRLAETVSLGERRILAVVEFEGQRLLLGATPQNIILLCPPVPRERQQAQACPGRSCPCQ